MKPKMRTKVLAVGMTLMLLLQGASAAVYAEEISVQQENRIAAQEESRDLGTEVSAAGEREADKTQSVTEETSADVETASVQETSVDANSENAAIGEIVTEFESDESSGNEASDQQTTDDMSADGQGADGREAVSQEAAVGKEEASTENTALSSEKIVSGEELNVPQSEDLAGKTESVSITEDAECSGAALVGANKGVYYYGSKEDKADIPDTYIFDDELLKGDSLEYSAELATMSLSLVNASIASIRAGYSDKSQNLRAYLEDNGFSDFEANYDYTIEPTIETMGVACAHKQITDNGKTYTLLVIAPRSAGYKTEWGGNFKVGTEGDHDGFEDAKNTVLLFARDYIQKYGLQGDIKVWTAGGSRGAGVTNLVGADLLRDPEAALGDSVMLSPENLYCYTFGTPKAADITSEDYKENNESKYSYIHNLSEPNDVVGIFAPSDMGFGRYGVTTEYVDPELKDSMLEFLRATSETMYRMFTGGGDPDTFISLKIDLQALLSEKSLNLTPATGDYYLTGMTQADYMQLLEGSMMEVFQNRENYAENYEAPMQHFFGYVYGGSGGLGTLFKGVKESNYMVPTVATMYISVVLEKYLQSESKADETIADLRRAIDELDAVIQEMPEGEQALGAELQARYNQLKDALKSAEAQKMVNDALLSTSWKTAADFYSKAMTAGLSSLTTLNDEQKALLTSDEDSLAMTKLLAYMLLVDPAQEQQFGFKQLGDQFLHLATTLGNAKSFMTPHYNEVILAWLRAQDPNYQDFEKANSAQATGYRRVFVEQPEGVDVTGTVKDSAGNVVAVFKNGKLESATDLWIGITTSDGGNWLRLPLNETYLIDFSTSADTTINVRVSEYSVDTGKEARVETSDSKYNWKDFAIRTVDSACLVVSAVEGEDGVYTLGSDAEYYFDLLKRFYITYNLNGGSLNGSSGSLTLLYDDGTGIKLPAPTRDGYIFDYWEGSRFNAGDPYTVLGDHLFKAIWKKADEGSKSEDSSEKKEYQQEVREKAANTYTTVISSSTVKTGTDTVQRAKAADTADTTPVEFWLLIMAVSLFAIMAMTVRSRQKRRV